jgi:hypothetical protein
MTFYLVGANFENKLVRWEPKLIGRKITREIIVFFIELFFKARLNGKFNPFWSGKWKLNYVIEPSPLLSSHD